MKKKIINTNICIGGYKSFLERMGSLAKDGLSSYVCVANVHMLIEAYKDCDFNNVVNNADIVTPDGVPLAKSIEFFYGIKQDRVAGMDLLPDLLLLSEKNKLPVYFYGGTNSMLELTRLYVTQKYPNLILAGLYSPPFRPLSEEEENEIIKKINQSEAKFVFVALGCPKQEKWMSSMKGKINACMVGIGGALPVMIGMQKRAPLWMQEFGLEWLFRLIQEPKRLFKRYFYTNSLFCFLFMKTLISLRFNEFLFRYNNIQKQE